jgi:prepilin-type N-terminal cleavage/methylation domain-containing protein
MNKPKGFSLIELLVVIAIIALLSTMAVVSLSNARQKARDSRRQGDLKAIQTAVELYKTSNDTDSVPEAIPSRETGWSDLQTALKDQIGNLPVDPQNSIGFYVYCSFEASSSETRGKFILATPLEQNIDIASDIDGSIAMSGVKCATSNPSIDPSQIDKIVCADSNAGQIGGFATNKTIFCLGNPVLE